MQAACRCIFSKVSYSLYFIVRTVLESEARDAVIDDCRRPQEQFKDTI